MEQAFWELMRPRYIVAAFIVGAIIGWVTMTPPPPV